MSVDTIVSDFGSSGKRPYYHGGSPRGAVTPEYRAWQNLRQRCLNPTYRNYPTYGGRGITVCAEWREDFAAFLADVGKRPSSMHTFDRIDNDGNYEPGNVRWATRTQQQRNRRSNLRLTFRGQTRCMTEWACVVGLSPHMVQQRLKYGWTVERALTTPRFGRQP